MHVLQVNARDSAGGAERIAWMLHRGLQARGHTASIVVGFRTGEDPGVRSFPAGANYGFLRARLSRVERRLARAGDRVGGAWRLSRLVRALVEPGSILDALQGREDYRYPGTWRLLEPPATIPDVIHLHNLHGDYFDLRALPRLCRQAPVLITLHDMWMLTGLCIYSFGCERFTSGCGACRLLGLRPSLVPSWWRQDATAANWSQKREIYAQSRLWAATPSLWLMNKVRESILVPAVVEGRVIPNGVDLAVFHPGDRRQARKALAIPPETPVVLTVSSNLLGNAAKGFGTISEAVSRVAARRRISKLLLLALGARAP